jgi:ribosomal protein S16
MTRVTVYRYDRDNQPVESVGWFTPENAESLTEANPMTADRYAEAQRGGWPARAVRETLYRTREGRWVLKTALHVDGRNRWVDDEANARQIDGMPQFRFLAVAEVVGWLTRNGYGDRMDSLLPDLPDEWGPDTFR